MGEPVPISLGLRSNPSRHAKQAGNARHVNCFAEELGEEGKTQWAISACPGLQPFADAGGEHGVRRMLEVGPYLYFVAGALLLKVDQSGNLSTISGLPSLDPAYMRTNRAVPPQIGLVTGGYYAVIQGDVLTSIEDEDLPPPSCIAQLDGYGILPGPNGRYMLTGIDDFASIDGLDEGTAESNPDAIVMAHELERECYFFGPKSVEAHQNTGDADFPLTRSQAIEVGCAAPDSVAPVDTPTGRALMFVAHDHTVRLMRGYSPVPVSTGEIEAMIAALIEAGGAETLKGASWSWAGRSFYALSSPTWTRCYDTKTGGWHERRSSGMERWRIGDVASFGRHLIAADTTTGTLYRMGDGIYHEAGAPLMMEVITPAVHMFPYAGICNALYIDAVTGVGLASGADSDVDPIMLVDWSKDGGETWCAPREVKIHREGQTARRVQPILRLGQFRQKGITFRFRIPAAVKKVLLSASVNIDRLALNAA